MKISRRFTAIRAAVRKGSSVTFTYADQPYTADLYQMGQAKRWAPYVVFAWCLRPSAGWKHFLFSRIKDLVIVGDMGAVRDDFEEGIPGYAIIDTRILPLPRLLEAHPAVPMLR
jgi:hypothetical protein